MRLIDADALRDEVLYDNTYDSHTVNYYLDVIDDAPTIGRDNKTGRIKTSTHKWICFERLAQYEDEEERGLLVRLPCKVGENCFVVSHTDKTITEITVIEFSYSIWHDAWVVAAANGHQFFLDNAYRARAEAEAAMKGDSHA